MALKRRRCANILLCAVLLSITGIECQPTTGSCTSSTQGRGFYLAFMEIQNAQRLNIQVFASRGALAAGQITITITTGGQTINQVINTNQPLNIDLSPATGVNVLLNGTGIQNKGVFISASADVSVIALIEEQQSCTALHAIPAATLSRNYVAVTYAPLAGVPSGNFIAQIAVVATADNTQVQLTFPTAMSGTVFFNGQSFSGGQTLTTTLNRLFVLQVQSESELSGTVVTGSNTIAVFSGNAKASPGEAVRPVMEQVLPFPSGTSPSIYVFVGLPGTAGYSVKIVATQPNTEMTVRTPGGIAQQGTLATVGTIYKGDFPSSQATIVECNKPVQATQLGLSPPSMLNIPSTSSYLSSYQFTVPFETSINDYTVYLVLIANSADINTFQVNGAVISPSWSSVNIAGQPYQVANVTVPGGFTTVTNTNNGAQFGVAVYGYSTQRNCAFSYPGDMCLDFLTSSNQGSSGSSVGTIPTLNTTPRPSFVSSQSTVSAASSTSTVAPPAQSSTTRPSAASAASSAPAVSTTTTVGVEPSRRPGTPAPSQTSSVSSAAPGSSTTAQSTAGPTQGSAGSESSTLSRRRETPTQSGNSQASQSSTTTPLSAGSVSSAISSTPTFSAQSNTPTFTAAVSSTPTFGVETSSLMSPGQNSGLSTQPSAQFSASPTGPVTTIGPSAAFSSSAGFPSGQSTLTGLLSGSSSFTTQPTLFSSNPSSPIISSPGSQMISSPSSPSRLPTDFSVSSGSITSGSTPLTGGSRLSSISSNSRIPTDFTTVSRQTGVSPTSHTRIPTDFSTTLVSGLTGISSSGSGISTVSGSGISSGSTVSGSGISSGSTVSGISTSPTSFSEGSSGTSGTPRTPGPVGSKQYTIPIDTATGQGQSVLLHITNPSDSPVTVSLLGPDLNKQVTVDPSGVHDDRIARPSSFPSGLLSETVRLSAENPFLLSVTNVGSCAGYLGVPTEGLGRSYQVVTWDPSSQTMGNAWFTVTTVNETLITVTLPPGDCTVTSSYVTLSCGDVFSVALPEYAALTFTSPSDLSGTLVQSMGPVLVIAGNDKVTIGPANVVDTSITELLPVEAWDTDFVVPGVPDNNGTGYSIKLISTTAATVTIKTSAQTSTVQLTAGVASVVNFTDNPTLSISSTQPIQVVQFIRGGQSSADTGCPAAMYITSTSLYTNTYYVDVWISKSQFVNYVTVVIEASALTSNGGLMMDDTAVSGDGWSSVPGSTLKVKKIEISDQRTSFSHATVAFGLFRYSYLLATDIDTPCALAYVAGIDYYYESEIPASTAAGSTGSTSQTQKPSTVTTTVGSITTAAPTLTEINDCSCLSLTSSISPSVSGQYFKQSSKYNDNAVYKRQDCELYLYDYEDPDVGYWLVGPEVGKKQGYVSNMHIYQLANETTPGSWKVYNSTSGELVQDPKFQIVCSCNVSETCASGEFMQNGSSLFDGSFTFSGEHYNGHQVYWHDSHSMVLYYADKNCTSWGVSDTLGSSNFLIYSDQSSAMSPGDVTQWRHIKLDTKQNPITFQCAPSSTDSSDDS